MALWNDYDNLDLAKLALAELRKLTGDSCHLIKLNNRLWRIVRRDPSGKWVGLSGEVGYVG